MRKERLHEPFEHQQRSFDARNDTLAYEIGFVTGQACAYVEQVIAGAKLAAQIGCSKDRLPDVISAIEGNGCQYKIEDRGFERVAVWIYKQPFVAALIDDMQKKTTPPTAPEVWSMGKLFGYSDYEIGAYLQAHGLIKSAFSPEPNQLPDASKHG
jgi:hypothetical protein